MSSSPIAGHIMCCEQAKHRLLVLDAAQEWGEDTSGVWSWSAESAPDIAREHVQWFTHPSDAKPVLGGSHVLATFSGQAVVLIRMSDKKVVYYASAGGNPHSAELLPDGNIITASSHGSYLRLFKTDPAIGQFPNQVSFLQVPFQDAHGVVWDQKRERIWAVGGRELKRYRYDRAEMSLFEEAAFPLTGGEGERLPGGHDLGFNATGDRLFVTTMRNVFLFDPAGERLVPYEPIGSMTAVKSISEQSAGGAVLLMRATESWWSDTLRFVGDDRVKRLPGAKFYKARWWPKTTPAMSPDK